MSPRPRFLQPCWQVTNIFPSRTQYAIDFYGNRHIHLSVLCAKKINLAEPWAKKKHWFFDVAFYVIVIGHLADFNMNLLQFWQEKNWRGSWLLDAKQHCLSWRSPPIRWVWTWRVVAWRSKTPHSASQRRRRRWPYSRPSPRPMLLSTFPLRGQGRQC